MCFLSCLILSTCTYLTVITFSKRDQLLLAQQSFAKHLLIYDLATTCTCYDLRDFVTISLSVVRVFSLSSSSFRDFQFYNWPVFFSRESKYEIRVLTEVAYMRKKSKN